MKKISLFAVLVLTLSLLTGAAVFAQGHGGHGAKDGTGPRAAAQELTPEQLEAHKKFMEATATQRAKLAADAVELQALMRAQNPDPKAARALAESMNTTREEIRAKAEELGIETPGCGMMGAGGGCGMMGGGMMGGKRGMKGMMGGCPMMSGGHGGHGGPPAE